MEYTVGDPFKLLLLLLRHSDDTVLKCYNSHLWAKECNTSTGHDYTARLPDCFCSGREKKYEGKESLQPWPDTKQNDIALQIWMQTYDLLNCMCSEFGRYKILDVFCNSSFGRNESCQTFPVAPKSLLICALGNCAELQLLADEGLVRYAGWCSSAAPSVAQILNVSTFQSKFVSSEHRQGLPKSYNYHEQTIFKHNIPLEVWTKSEIRLVTLSSKKTKQGGR